MHHQFSNISGRLIGNHNMLPYYPISAAPLSKYELPKPVFATANQKLATETPRYAGTMAAKRMPGSSELYGPMSEALRRKMEKFQRNDGVPVHLKGGAFDKILFGATVGLCFLGIAMTLHMIYDMAIPKKKK